MQKKKKKNSNKNQIEGQPDFSPYAISELKEICYKKDKPSGFLKIVLFVCLQLY